MKPSQPTHFSRFKTALAALVLTAVGLMASTPSQAVTTIGVENSLSGFVGSLLATFPDYLQVASDGELSFQPFNITVDVSDAIFFGPYNADPWQQAPDSTWTSHGNGVWYLPAANPGPGCPPENMTDTSTCHEAIGHWFNTSGSWIGGVLGDYVISSEDGSVGDIIRLYNVNDVAHVMFSSDPIGLPEPTSLALLGAAALVAAARPRKRHKIVRH